MAELAQADANAHSEPRARKLDRSMALAALALVVASASVVVALSRASASDVADVRDEVSLVQADAVSQSDLQGVEARVVDVEVGFSAMETKMRTAEDSIARLDALSKDTAAASKVDAAMNELRSEIASLRRSVNELCSEVNSSSTGPIPLPVPVGGC